MKRVFERMRSNEIIEPVDSKCHARKVQLQTHVWLQDEIQDIEGTYRQIMEAISTNKVIAQI